MAVAWWTGGMFLSRDVDLLLPTAPLYRVLRGMGFAKEGRYGYREDLDVILEAPGTTLDAYRDRTETVAVEAATVTVVSVEEAILDRLRARTHGRSELDCDQAFLMMVVHVERFDWAYVGRRAEHGQLQAELAELRARLEKAR